MPNLQKNKLVSIGAVFLIDQLIKKPLNSSIKINLLNSGVWIDSNKVYTGILKTVKKHLKYYQK